MASASSSLELTRALLDRALICLAQVDGPPQPLRPIADELSRAIVALQTCESKGADRASILGAWKEARDSTAAAERLLHGAEAEELGRIRQLLEEARERMQAGGPLREDVHPPAASASVPPVLLASVDEPRLLAFPRPLIPPEVPLAPVEDLPKPIPQIDTSENVAAAVEATPVLQAQVAAPAPPTAEEEQFGRALEEAEVIFERTRTCMEDLAAFSGMRRPESAPSLIAQATIERRLLARIDCLVSFGVESWPPLVRLLEDRPLPDPELVWAHLFFFGSLSGDDALAQVGRLAQLPALDEPAMIDSVADALALAPHPGVGGLVRPWLQSSLPGQREVAVTALARRGELAPTELLAAVKDGELSVVMAAARALAALPAPVDAGILQRLLGQPEESVVEIALAETLRLDPSLALRRARDLCQTKGPGYADAAMVIALGGGDWAKPLLWQGAQRREQSSLRALGWYGDLSAVPLLLALLAEEGAHQDPAVEALYRLLGAPITDDEPDPEPLAGRPETIEILTPHAEAWSAWWAKHHKRFKPGRTRFGHPWSLDDNLWELGRSAKARLIDRRRAHLELTARTSERSAFPWGAFLPARERQLAALEDRLRAKVAAGAGTWLTPVKV